MKRREPDISCNIDQVLVSERKGPLDLSGEISAHMERSFAIIKEPARAWWAVTDRIPLKNDERLPAGRLFLELSANGLIH